jgi:S-formylglutathione hydrolase FrmB
VVAPLSGAGWKEYSLESEALAGNPLRDPDVRPLFIWAPEERDRALPALFLLHPMTAQVRTWFNVSPFEPSPAEQIAALALEAIVVLVDGWTALGGSQWIDSAAIGRYGSYLCEDVVGFVDERFDVSARALAGRSSGGFGAMLWGMRRPDLFAGFATHAGDALFDVTYTAEFAAAAQALRNLYDGSVDAFWADFRSGRPVFANRTDPLLQNVAAAAAAFSDGELPFRLDTAELVQEPWSRWLAWDPVLLAPHHAPALREAQAIWIDAGRTDEYHLDLAAVAFHQAVEGAGVKDAHFELHEGGHRGTNSRLLESLPFLAERLR